MTRRGLSLLELMLALAITAMIAGAISAMLTAVSTGVNTRDDAREVLVAGHAGASRLGAYITPSRCILGADADGLVLWLHDNRSDRNVHATEIRWLEHDSASDEFVVQFVSFPDDWSEAERELADRRFPADADWETVRLSYEALGFLSTMPLLDEVTTCSIALDERNAMEARHAVFSLERRTGGGTVALRLGFAVRAHEPPDGGL